MAQYFDLGLGVERDYVQAAYWMELVAEKGFVDAQMRLGEYYEQGLGVPVNPGEALKWLLLAAEQGRFEAQIRVAALLDSTGEFEKALVWYEKTALEGEVPSQYQLGLHAKDGLGIQINLPLAYQWFNLAAAFGHVQARVFRQELLPQLARTDLMGAQERATEIYRILVPKILAQRTSRSRLGSLLRKS